jgi:hypothetical protein
MLQLAFLLLGGIGLTRPLPFDSPQDGYTPLLLACRKGQVETAKFLLEAKADPRSGPVLLLAIADFGRR